jgi:hypothetical protein
MSDQRSGRSGVPFFDREESRSDVFESERRAVLRSESREQRHHVTGQPKAAGAGRPGCVPNGCSSSTTPVCLLRVSTALSRLSHEAGIGHVTAHELRHTLATQAINRAMSIDAIAALLGHKTLAMTMIYAGSPTRPSPRSTSTSPRRSKPYTANPSNSLTIKKAARCANSAAKCTGACSATATAPPPGRYRLPLRIDLRELHLLRHHHPVPDHPVSPTRRRPQQGTVGRQKIFDDLLERLDLEASLPRH